MQRISAVSYLNTKPFLYGLQHSAIQSKIILSEDTPAVCAHKLINNEVDIGLVPVAIIPLLKNPQIVVPYCIAADGPVETVCLFSEVPIEEIETIYLDYQSRTSVELIKILMQEFWQKEVNYLEAFPNYEQKIKNKTAGVIIGDRAIFFKATYKYDLAHIWKQHTGLPFVFATWVSTKNIENSFLDEFKSALQLGLDNKSLLFENYQHLNRESFSVEEYLTKNILYELNASMQMGLELFLQKLHPEKQVVYCF